MSKPEPPPTPASPKRISLHEFALRERREERRKSCSVCRLPEDVRADLRTMRTKKITRDTAMRWLKAVVRIEVSDLELTTHYNGHHDDREQIEARP